MAKQRKKNKSVIYLILVVAFIVAATLFGEKLNTENIEALFSNVLNENILENVAQNEKVSEQQNVTQSLDISTEVINGEELVVHYFDVGQADSILIQSDGRNMLIDAGTNEKRKNSCKIFTRLRSTKNRLFSWNTST